MTNDQYPQSKHFLALILSQLMVGINIVGAKYLLSHISIILILCTRFMIATAFLGCIHWFLNFKKPSPCKARLRDIDSKTWGIIIAQALCAGVLFNFLLLTGLHYTDANIAGIITSVLPAIIALLSILFLQERANFFTSLCILFAILGLLAINIHSFHLSNLHSLVGATIVLIALLPEAMYYVLSKLYHNRLSIFTVALLMNLINLVVVLIIASFTLHLSHYNLSLSDVLILIIIGLASAMFYVFWYSGCQYINGSTAGLLTAIMPIGTLLLAWIFLGETINKLQLLGMLLVIASIITNALQKKRAESNLL